MNSKKPKEKYLPLAPIRQQMKDVTNMLIAKDCGEAMREIVEGVIEKLTLDALEFSKVEKRKTIQKKHLESAYKNWRRNW